MRSTQRGVTTLILGSAIALAAGSAAPTNGAEAGHAIVVQNAYFPRLGLEEEVYQTRLRASAVRARLGLVVGRVLRRADGPEGGPYVIWEAEYPDLLARERDVEALSGNADFDAVAEHMGTLLERFERTLWAVGEPAEPIGSENP
jgi:hypothetical protein